MNRAGSRALAITGSYRGVTGYDHLTRSIARALDDRGISIELHDIPMWSPAKLPAHLQDPWFDEHRAPVSHEAHLHVCMPHQVRPLAGVRSINYTMFEADCIPDSWRQHSLRHDLTIVPVESCRQAWVRGGVPADHVAVCPLGVDAARFAPGVAPLSVGTAWESALAERRVRFLNVADAIDRKNLIGVLRVWLRATSGTDDVAIVLKPGLYTRESQEGFEQQVQAIEHAVGRSFREAAPVFLLGGVLAPDAMPALYAAATHYISLSRGEGFDLPMLEAGVSGLQLIAPRHSAYLDYLDDRIAHLVHVRAVDARLPGDPATAKFFAGAGWWEPEEDHACQIIRDIVDGKPAGKESAREVLMPFSWAKTAERLEQLIFGS